MNDRLGVIDTVLSPLIAEKLLLAEKIQQFLDAGGEINMGEVGTLYPNQLTAIDKLRRFLQDPEADDIGYMVQPTGSGKTLIMALIVKLFDIETLMLVPRVNLLEYTKNELISLGIKAEDIGIVGGGMYEIGRKITLSTYQSHLSRKNDPLYQLHNKNKKFIVCDEAHTALGQQTRAAISDVLVSDNDTEYDDIFSDEELKAQSEGLAEVAHEYEGQAVILGFTATPKLAGKEVGSYFKNEIAREGLVNMIKGGVLAKLRVAQLDGDIQKGTEMIGNKISQEHQANILSRNDAYRKLLDKYEAIFAAMLAEDQIPRAVARCTNIAEANKLADLLRARGFRAELCTSRDEDARTPQQQRLKLARLEDDMLAGRLDVIITVDKLAMGWNFPAANIAIDATASASPAKILQFVGRILRRAKNKKYATLICMSWLVRGSRPKKAQASETDDETDKNPTEKDPDDNPAIEGSGRNQRYDFFRALLDSGEDMNEVFDVLTDESEGRIMCDLEEMQDALPLDVAYFSSAEKVLFDLTAFAKAIGTSLVGLSTGPRHCSVYATCANGETMRLPRYLNNASLAFNVDSRAVALLKLKKLVGVEIAEYLDMDAVYFRCRDCIGADLQGYAEKIGVKVEDLTTNARYSAASICCMNGEEVKWQTYIRRASKAYSVSELDALRSLKLLIGLNAKVYSPMESVYFASTATIKSDLQRYADLAGVHIADLNMSERYATLIAACENGEDVRFDSYLRRAAKVLGLKREAETLLHLKNLIGMERSHPFDMDEVYFRCTDCVRSDLTQYATVAGQSLQELMIHRGYVTCTNNELVSLHTYANRAARALGIESQADALFQLKQLVGVVTLKPIVMDAVYYRCSDCVKADLQKYAKSAGVQVWDLTTTAKHRALYVICANGELVSWQTYLKRAVKVFDAALTTDALRTLIQLSEIEIPSRVEMDQAYFRSKRYVLSDLTLYAQGGGVTIANLKPNPHAAVEATCCNSDVIKFQSYIKRAQVSLGFSKPTEALDFLRKVALSEQVEEGN